MSPNLLSEANDGSTAVSSKTSLLWAYQLRKEHIHLVNRIEDVNSDLLSCSSRATEHHQNLSNLERLVKSLQTENYTLKNEVTIVRDKFEASLDQVNKQVAAAMTTTKDGREERTKEEKKSLAELECGFEHLGLRMEELAQGMVELKMGMAGMEKKCECLAVKQMELAAWQGKMPPPKKPGITTPKSRAGRTQTGIRASLIVCLRYSKTDEGKDDYHGKQAGSFTQMTYPADEAAISAMTDSLIPDSMPVYPAVSPIDLIFQQIKQDDHELYDYFTFAAELRSELPRRKQEGHMVEAFFNGLSNDSAVKMAMEEYLDALGWIWSNVEGFCRRDQQGYNTRSRTRASATKSRVKSVARKGTVEKDMSQL